MRDTEREAETQAEGEAGSMQGARLGTRSWVSRIRPWAERGAKLLSQPGCHLSIILYFVFFFVLALAAHILKFFSFSYFFFEILTCFLKIILFYINILFV